MNSLNTIELSVLHLDLWRSNKYNNKSCFSLIICLFFTSRPTLRRSINSGSNRSVANFCHVWDAYKEWSIVWYILHLFEKIQVSSSSSGFVLKVFQTIMFLSPHLPTGIPNLAEKAAEIPNQIWGPFFFRMLNDLDNPTVNSSVSYLTFDRFTGIKYRGSEVFFLALITESDRGCKNSNFQPLAGLVVDGISTIRLLIYLRVDPLNYAF